MTQSSGSVHRSSTQANTLSPTIFWRLAEDIPKPLNTALVVTSIGLPVLLWWLVTTFGNVDPKFLPSPAMVLEAFGRLWSTGELLKDTVASLWRVGEGFLLAVFLSIPVGVLMGSFASIRALLEPLFGSRLHSPTDLVSRHWRGTKNYSHFHWGLFLQLLDGHGYREVRA